MSLLGLRAADPTGSRMRLNAGHLEHARRVADAILYEGYLLYPYRKSAQKNQARFQFGVLMPPGYAAVDPHERSASQTECLLECGDDAEVRVLVRFLHLRRRMVQGVSPENGELHDVGTLYVDGTEYTSWDEATEREQRITAVVSALLAEEKVVEFHLGTGESVEDLTDRRGRKAGCLVRRWNALDGVVRLHAERVAGPFQALKLRVRVENSTTPLAGMRSQYRRAAVRAYRRALADGGSRRNFRVHDRRTGVGRSGDRGLPERGHVAGAGRTAGLPRPDAVVAGDPL